MQRPAGSHPGHKFWRYKEKVIPSYPALFGPRSQGDEDPPHDPDTPPDSADPAGVCPRCGRLSNFTLTGDPIPLLYTGAVMEEIGGRATRMHYEQVSVFECLGCHQGIAVIEEMTVGNKPTGGKFVAGGTVRWRGVNWWPPASGSSVDEAVPERIRDIFGEGLRCLGAKAPRAAAVMFGRTLEAIVRDKGSERAVAALKDNLAAALDVMVAEHQLTPGLAVWAKEVRLARNAGGHDELVDDVTPDEARNLSKFLDQLLMNLYVMDSRLRRAKAPKPPKA